MKKNSLKRYYNKFKMVNAQNFKFKIGLLIFLFIFICYTVFTKVYNSNIDGRFILSLIMSFIVLILSMMLHEIAHGLAAYIFGDNTAKNAGRLTLNPIKHMDLKGFLLPVVLFLLGSPILFGWAKPVPVNLYKIKESRFVLFVVAIRGIFVNSCLALLSYCVIKFIMNNPKHLINIANIISSDTLNISYTFIDYIFMFFVLMYYTNIFFALFNLIPVTPLDGGRIVYSIGNTSVRKIFDQVESYGIILVFVLVYAISHFGVFEIIFNFFTSLLF